MRPVWSFHAACHANGMRAKPSIAELHRSPALTRLLLPRTGCAPDAGADSVHPCLTSGTGRFAVWPIPAENAP